MTLPAPPYTAVVDRLTAVDLTAVKTELGISGATYDDRLTRWIRRAKVEADLYLNNPFWQRSSSSPYNYLDPVVELAIPDAVTDYVLDFCAYQMGNTARTGLVSSERVRDLARSYRTPEAALDTLKRVHLQPYRLSVGIGINPRGGGLIDDPRIV